MYTTRMSQLNEINERGRFAGAIESIKRGYTDVWDHDGLLQALCELYADEIPYGTWKARTGDPDVWVMDAIERDWVSDWVTR